MCPRLNSKYSAVGPTRYLSDFLPAALSHATGSDPHRTFVIVIVCGLTLGLPDEHLLAADAVCVVRQIFGHSTRRRTRDQE